MPYRNAVWALVLLAPLIVLAFWPAYFGDMGHAPLAFHAHGLTATLWLCLVALQSWSAHRHDRTLHRVSGRAVFAAVPLFAAGAVMVLHSMATKFATKSDPFYGALGARLGMHDIVSTTVLVGLVTAALIWRRKTAIHGACMLATVLLVLPPVIARLPIPRFFHSGELIVIALALAALWREPRGRMPFLILIGVQVVQIVLFETVSASPAWETTFAGLSQLTPWPFAIAAALIALSALWIGWKKGGAARKPVVALG